MMSGNRMILGPGGLRWPVDLLLEIQPRGPITRARVSELMLMDLKEIVCVGKHSLSLRRLFRSVFDRFFPRYFINPIGFHELSNGDSNFWQMVLSHVWGLQTRYVWIFYHDRLSKKRGWIRLDYVDRSVCKPDHGPRKNDDALICFRIKSR